MATTDTTLGREVAAWEALHPGETGYYPLSSGTDALGARLALIEKAERSIDIQYFLMKPDNAGLLFGASLMRAAERGVRIRLLLDDVFTLVEDRGFGTLSRHENVEVRLFNPVARRGVFYLNYLAGFERANRRMHNKAFVVDNQVSVIGGRNIADEYFELQQATDFKDFDMLAVGAISRDISAQFDRYWNHELAVPIEAFTTERSATAGQGPAFTLAPEEQARVTAMYQRAVDSPLLSDLLAGRRSLYPARSHVVADDPDKLLQAVSPQNNILANELSARVASATAEVVVITPYLIPGEDGVQFWREQVRRGLKVVMLTNSLASNNHLTVHGAYSRYRQELVRAGVELYELRTKPTVAASPESATLHTKLAVIDREVLAVGSLNLDPRSIDLNTEVAVIIESPGLGQQIASQALSQLPDAAYRLGEDGEGRLQWTMPTADGEERFDRDPDAGRWRRLLAWLSKLLPESQL